MATYYLQHTHKSPCSACGNSSGSQSLILYPPSAAHGGSDGLSDDHHDDHFYDNYCHPYLSPHVVLKQHEEQLCKEAGLDYGLYAQYCSAQ